jgi:uncharacterized protein YuzE
VATVSPESGRRFLGHYDPEVDIAWIRFEGHDGGTARAVEHPWGLEERDPRSGEIVALELWNASGRLPAEFLSLFPSPGGSAAREAGGLLEDAIAWLEVHYRDEAFWLARDLTTALQRHMAEVVRRTGRPEVIVPNHRTKAGLVDLAVLRDRRALALFECKYEPDRDRSDFSPRRHDQPVVSWHDDVVGDIRRVAEAVLAGDAPVGYALFVDEGRRFDRRVASPASSWIDWSSGPTVLKSVVDEESAEAVLAWAGGA